MIEMGYIEPGHGARGKQRWILNAGDLEDMYEAYTQEKLKSCSGCMPQLVNVQARVDESVQGPHFPQKKNRNLVNLMHMPKNWYKLNKRLR